MAEKNKKDVTNIKEQFQLDVHEIKVRFDILNEMNSNLTAQTEKN